MKTQFLAKEAVDRKWYVIDAEGKILGRMAVRIAVMLQGKHKPNYTPHVDNGDFIIVVNAEKVRVTGRKMETKTYDYNTGYPSGRRIVTLADKLAKKPAEVIHLAVRRMLPKTKLGRAMFKKLKVYAGADHPHEAQQPEALEIQES